MARSSWIRRAIGFARGTSGVVPSKALKNAGLPSIRFHDLRHTAATLMLLSGINVKPVVANSSRSSRTAWLSFPMLASLLQSILANGLLTEWARGPHNYCEPRFVHQR